MISLNNTLKKVKQIEPVREWNLGPLAPKSRIMPLDQQASTYVFLELETSGIKTAWVAIGLRL